MLAFLTFPFTHLLFWPWAIILVVATALAIKWAKPQTIVGKLGAAIPPAPEL